MILDGTQTKVPECVYVFLSREISLEYKTHKIYKLSYDNSTGNEKITSQ